MLDILREGPSARPRCMTWSSPTRFLFWVRTSRTRLPSWRSGCGSRRANNRSKSRDKLQIPLWQDHAVAGVARPEGPFFLATVNATRLDDLATETYRAAPDDLARLGFAVAHELDGSAQRCRIRDPRSISRRTHRARIKKMRNGRLLFSGSGCQRKPLSRRANVARALCKSESPRV